MLLFFHFPLTISLPEIMITLVIVTLNYPHFMNGVHMKTLKNTLFTKSFWFFTSFLLLLIIMWCSPFTSDDIEFQAMGLKSFKDIFDHALYYGNGRLLGNILVIYLVNSRVLGCIVRALTLSLIIILLPAVLNIKVHFAYALSFLLTLGISPTVFGQVFSWTSGFSNYVFPILGVLLSIRIIQVIEQRVCKPFCKVLGSLLIFILGFCSQLFVENTTTTIILLSLAMVLNSFYNKQKKHMPRIILLISSIIGGFAMFFIPRLFYLNGNRTEGYRGFLGKGLRETIRHFSSSASSILLVFSNSILLLLAIYVCIILVCNKISIGKKISLYFRISSSSAFIYALFNYLMRNNEWFSVQKTIANSFKILSSVGALILLVNLFILAFFIDEIHTKHLLLFLGTFALIPAVQLLIVYPVTERTVWISVVALTAALLKLSDYCLSDKENGTVCNSDCDSQLNRFPISYRLLLVNFIFSITLLATFVNIRQLDNLRDNYISDKLEQGCDEITIFAIPSDYAFWDGAWAYNNWITSADNEPVTFNVKEINDWLSFYYNEIDGKAQ